MLLTAAVVIAIQAMDLRKARTKIASLTKVEAVNKPLENQVVQSQLFIDSMQLALSALEGKLADLQRFDPNAEGVFFEVQLGIFKYFSLDHYQDYLIELRQYDSSNHHFILLGRFDRPEPAHQLVQELKKLGLRNCFVVGRINGRLISEEEALSKLDQATF